MTAAGGAAGRCSSWGSAGGCVCSCGSVCVSTSSGVAARSPASMSSAFAEAATPGVASVLAPAAVGDTNLSKTEPRPCAGVRSWRASPSSQRASSCPLDPLGATKYL